MKKLAGAVNYRYLLSLLLSILFAFLIGAGILAVSGFRHTEMQGKVHSFFFHYVGKQTHGFYHDYGVGCFDGDNDIREFFRDTDSQKFHARFYHAFRGVAVT